MGKIKITSHGQRRAKKRAHIPTNKQKEMVQRALKYGVSFDDATGDLAEYLDRRIGSNPRHTYRVYGQSLYVVSKDGHLVTLIKLPTYLIAEADRLCAEKKAWVIETQAPEFNSNSGGNTATAEDAEGTAAEAEAAKAEAAEAEAANKQKHPKHTKKYPSTQLEQQIEFGISKFKYLNNVVLLIGGEVDQEAIANIQKRFNKLGISTLHYKLNTLPYEDWGGTKIQGYKDYCRACFVEYLGYLNASTYVLVVNESDADPDNDIPENDIDTETLLKIHTAYLYNKQVFILNNIPEDLEYYDTLISEVSATLGGEILGMFAGGG